MRVDEEKASLSLAEMDWNGLVEDRLVYYLQWSIVVLVCFLSSNLSLIQYRFANRSRRSIE